MVGVGTEFGCSSCDRAGLVSCEFSIGAGCCDGHQDGEEGRRIETFSFENLPRLVGLLLRDVVLTRVELVGLKAALLTSNGIPTGTTRLGEWLANNAEGIRHRYVSELRRNLRR